MAITNANIIKALANANIPATATYVTKNGVKKRGFTLGDGQIKPTIYVEKGMSLADIVEFAKRAVGTESPVAGLDVSLFSDYENVKDKLSIRLATVKDKGVVYKSAFADFYIMAQVLLGEGMSFKVTEQLLKTWNITNEQLFEDAIENAKEISPVTYSSLNGFVKDAGYEISDEVPDITILSNEQMLNGAAVLCYARLPREFYMLPSSVHEVLILPPKMVEDESMLTEMVQSVNSTEVAPEERLSDHAYYCKNGDWRIIA